MTSILNVMVMLYVLESCYQYKAYFYDFYSQIIKNHLLHCFMHVYVHVHVFMHIDLNTASSFFVIRNSGNHLMYLYKGYYMYCYSEK